MTDVAANLARIRAGAGNASLIAVSKGHEVDAITAALEAGHRVFGENRVQKAARKFADLRRSYPDIVLHMIGPLQTNKVAAAVELFDVIQTLDRPALAAALARVLRKSERRPRFYIEVNIGHEPQKTGVAPEDAGNFLDYCRRECGLSIDGLMVVPPQGQDPRVFFERLGLLGQSLYLPRLSMGMSADYEIAVACGATDIRVGTAVFGDR